MLYQDLNELINNSKSSRYYFMSLSPNIQYELHKYGEFIHSSAQLHKFVYDIKINKKLIELGSWNK